MDVSAFDLATSPAKELVLGAIADAIWINGFKRSQKRTIQVSRPVRASAPVLYDRVTKVESFSFVAGQSFSDAAGGLAQMSTWPDKVPVLAHLRFKSGTDIEWLGNCGIDDVQLVEKRGALVVFSYTIIGGTWSKNKPS